MQHCGEEMYGMVCRVCGRSAREISMAHHGEAKFRDVVTVQWTLHRDLDEMAAIEDVVFADPWNSNQLRGVMAQRNVISLTAKHSCGAIGGYMIYQLQKGRIVINRLAVLPTSQRRRIGTALAARLIEKVRYGSRNKVTCIVPERNMGALLFFRALNFRAVRIHRDWDAEGDGYEMTWHRTS